MHTLQFMAINSFYFTMHVIVFTETWLKPNVLDSEIFCSSFTIYRRDRRSFAGGLLIAIQNSVLSELVILPDFILVYNNEFLAVRIVFASQTIFLTCSYIPPQSKSDIYIQQLLIFRFNF